MMREEFEKLNKCKVLDSDWKIINFVYTWHPVIRTHEQMTDLWQIGGRRLMLDMYQTAKKCCELTQKLTEMSEGTDEELEAVQDV